MAENRICPVCGKRFNPNVYNQKFCSLACKRKQVCLDRPNNLSKKRICIICGKEFYPNASGQTTCSEECRTVRKHQNTKKHNDKKTT